MLLKLYDQNNSYSDLRQTTEILESGGLLIFPTEYRYAIGCHALKERAIENICRLKGVNPQKNRLSIICYSMSTISEYTRMDNGTFKLMKKNLPGPFTFILPGSNKLPKIFLGRKEVGIRMPSSPIVMEIARTLGAPLMTASLPVGDDEDPEYFTNPELIDEMFGDRVDCIIDGGLGHDGETTVVDCTSGEAEIVRQGMGILEY